MPILVANASEHGTTQQIAEHVAERLAAARHQAEARPRGDQAGYGAFVIGSAAHAFRRPQEACEFVRRNRAVLAGLSGVTARNAVGVSRKARLLGDRPLRTRALRSPARSVAVSPEIPAPMTVQSLLRKFEG
jgi:menaquinone-dependent protoporphyrinogen IX oxidase